MMRKHVEPLLYILCSVLLVISVAAVYRAGKPESPLPDSDPAGAESRTQPHFRLIAHRGYSRTAPENTLPAFAAAARAGFDCIETDLRFTADGQMVLIHNPEVDGTSNGSGAVDSMTLAELKRLDFGGWYGAEYNGTRIPTFQEGLALCRLLGLELYLDLKVPDMMETQYQMIVDTVKAYGMETHVTFISFYLQNLQGIAEQDGQFSFRFLTFSRNLEEAHRNNDVSVLEAIDYFRSVPEKIREAGISWNSSRLTEEFARTVRDTGLLVEAWTVDDVADLLKLPPACSAVTTNQITRDAVIRYFCPTPIPSPSAAPEDSPEGESSSSFSESL